jgi:hypothetical protein
VSSKLCRTSKSNFMDQIRADFTVCALPADSLSGTCISGAQNEPDECGYGPNLSGLCSYCASSSPNSTDSCCVNTNASSRCINVTLPTMTSLPPLFPSSTSALQSSATSNSTSSAKLSGGQVAGVAVGSVAGFAVLVALLALLLVCLRRRRQKQNSVLNKPTPQRKGAPSMQQAAGISGQKGYELIPGGRVARMSALQGDGENSPARSIVGPQTTAGAAKYSDTSDSEALTASPKGASRRPPVTGRRNGSLSSASVLAGGNNSPQSAIGIPVSSPEGVASGQSEQLPYFRDYYSQEDIYPNDRVAALWAYQPRAGDEFELERGDMLKVVGIWDDGWATGVRVNGRAEDFDDSHNIQRDSGVSNGSEKRPSSPPPRGEIKAFPVRECKTLSR